MAVLQPTGKEDCWFSWNHGELEFAHRRGFCDIMYKLQFVWM